MPASQPFLPLRLHSFYYHFSGLTSFPPISHFSQHTNRVHYIPNFKKLTPVPTNAPSYCYFSHPNSRELSQGLPVHCSPILPGFCLPFLGNYSCQGKQGPLCCQLWGALSNCILFWVSEAFDKIKSSFLFETLTSLGLQNLHGVSCPAGPSAGCLAWRSGHTSRLSPGASPLLSDSSQI